MTTPAAPTDSNLLVHAYLDGELDPVHAIEMEHRLAADPALAAERDRIAALRSAIKEQLPPDPAPEDLVTLAEYIGGMRPEPVTSVVAGACGCGHSRGGDHGRNHLVPAASKSRRSVGRAGRRQPRARNDGAAADRCELVRPSHREAVVQRPHPAGAAGRRSHRQGLSAGRRPHRCDRDATRADTGLSPSPASDQPDRRADRERCATGRAPDDCRIQRAELA